TSQTGGKPSVRPMVQRRSDRPRANFSNGKHVEFSTGYVPVGSGRVSQYWILKFLLSNPSTETSTSACV
ncbi:hypothetical protein ACXWP3_09710, partial [Streptococcus pyogenes]